MATPSAALSDAQRALFEELDERVSSARLAWLAAQQRRFGAIAEEQDAFAVLNAASAASRIMKDGLARICVRFNVPAVSNLAVEPKAASLTADILAEIFRFTVDSYYFSEQDPSTPLPVCPAFMAASVSRHWRSVAIATPSVWSKVYLRFTASTCADIKARLDTILSRTRREPLDMVLLDIPSTERFDLFSQADEEALISAFSRSRSIRMSRDQPSITFKDYIFPLIQVHMPYLTTFAIIVGFDEFSPELGEVPANVRLLSLCPNLRELDMQKLPFAHIDPESIPLLEHFTICSALSDEQALALCRAWPKLRSLHVYSVVHVPPSSATSSDKFSNLVTLECLGAGTHFLQIFSSAHLPALQELSFQCKSSRDHRNFTSFLAPGPCTSLRTLRLHGMHAPSFLRSLASLPNLAKLCISDLPNHIVQELFTTWSSEDTVQHPLQLQSLQLTNCNFGENAAYAVLAFIEERKRSQSDDVTAISELIIKQYETYKSREDVFEPWMKARVEQLVEHVKIHTAGAFITG